MRGEALEKSQSVLSYPLDLGFKIATIGTRVRVSDATGRQIGYVRKKKFRLKEDVTVYEDESQKSAKYRIKADRVWDFSASYTISTPDGRRLGAVGRQGVKSLWRSSYSIVDEMGSKVGSIHEENPWTKVFDSLVEIIPFADAFDGLFFNPAYLISLRGEPVLRLRKERALFESRFALEKLHEFSEKEEDLLLPSVIMMILLERDRG